MLADFLTKQLSLQKLIKAIEDNKIKMDPAGIDAAENGGMLDK